MSERHKKTLILERDEKITRYKMFGTFEKADSQVATATEIQT